LSENPLPPGYHDHYVSRAPRHEPVADRESALPTHELEFDATTDVVVVGGGCAGLASSLFTSWLGDEVVLLEKAPEVGGTTFKSAFIYWVPNNGPLRESGVDDREEDFLRYAARISRPEKYDPDSPTFGQSEWEFAMYKAMYESGWPAVELLHERGALRYAHAAHWVDYWHNLPEDKVESGRGMIPADTNAEQTSGGMVAVTSMTAAAKEAGVDIRTSHRVQRLIMHDRVVAGVVATTADGETVRIGARKGVIFGSGGFTHDQELREHFLAVPAVGGCAARTNEGDFVRIGTAAGAQLRNMQFAWRCPISLEKAVNKDPNMQGAFAIAGDSMICVNYKGERPLNEKLPYNELVQRMYDWDPLNCDFPNRVLIQLWDQHTQDHSAADMYGITVVPEGVDDSHVIKGDTLQELVDNVRERLEEYRANTGNLQLNDDFLPTLEATIARWNEMARNGVDEDFHRGEREVEIVVFGGPLDDTVDKKNALMYQISESGPYYATLLTGGTLDTKGGPKINTSAQVVDDMDQPIPGLYGVGNCVAAAQARAYWAGGGTLGPMIAFAYRAANAIHEEPVRDWSQAPAAASSVA
jgi:3-oxosteroid 1-dehydrogenase